MLFLDTSAILNILGSGRPRLILENLSRQTFVPEEVLKEVKKEPLLEGQTDAKLADLLDVGLLEITETTADINRLALELAGAPAPDDLDDGESYAIACAVTLKGVIGIDDRKGRRILSTRWPTLPIQFTVELIEAAAMRAQLSTSEHADLVFSALINSRMRIPKDRRLETIRLIGRERAKQCPSLGIIP
jgi:predicted nucleic acid-binding protein